MVTSSEVVTLDTELNDAIDRYFKRHPFSGLSADINYENLLSNFLAMSQAFPYLQAGSHTDIFWHYVESSVDVPEDVERTFVVSNFLCWDETGGFNVTLNGGTASLPRILETKRFHANLLKNDCEKIFNKKIAITYSDLTRDYLKKLYLGLSSSDVCTRTAYMISFESHANQMISALWGTLKSVFPEQGSRLNYFIMHVGPDDPAEKYHVEMTRRLIQKNIPQEDFGVFLGKFVDSYRLNYDWCQALVCMSMLVEF